MDDEGGYSILRFGMVENGPLRHYVRLSDTKFQDPNEDCEYSILNLRYVSDSCSRPFDFMDNQDSGADATRPYSWIFEKHLPHSEETPEDAYDMFLNDLNSDSEALATILNMARFTCACTKSRIWRICDKLTNDGAGKEGQTDMKL